MQLTDTDNRVLQLVSRHLGADLEKLQLSNRLVDDLGADSLDVRELVFILEREFNVEISDANSDRVEAVHDLVDCVARSRSN